MSRQWRFEYRPHNLEPHDPDQRVVRLPRVADRERDLGGEHGPVAIKTAGLVGFWLLFLGAYLAICAIMATLMARSPVELARSFALTLVPIAIGYHVAHYLVFLLIQGQYIVPLASDPFGKGWNLFGTAGYRVDIAIVGGGAGMALAAFLSPGKNLDGAVERVGRRSPEAVFTTSLEACVVEGNADRAAFQDQAGADGIARA